ncbi:MAG: cytochrome C, partial [Chitinophagaceae bacterium]|nr:cytochrome C [Chitinophagaceae bacterium]
TNHDTGLANMSREQFLQRFAVYKDSSYRSPKLRPTDFNSPMPWTMYAGMTPEDLSAIYAYLRTVQPIDNTVEKFTAKRE